MEVQIIFVHILLHMLVQYCYYYIQQSEKQLTLTTLFQQPMSTSYTTFTGACAAFTSPAISILLHCTINTGNQQIFSTRAKRLASKYSDRPRSLFDAHSPRQPSVSPASPAFSAPESYFTMHASYLIICPRFTLGVAAVTEKNCGQTDGRTHTHTHTHTQTDRLQ